jgi:succinate-semialdehyde dehydrogenase/glutarate-semialdehyde dehydrogenase/succinyl-CoA reductase
MAQQTMEISTINPATEEILSNYEEMSKAKVESIVEKAKTAFSWWKLDYEKRRGCVYNLAEYLKKNKQNLQKLLQKKWVKF